MNYVLCIMNYVFLTRFSYNLFTKMLLLFRIFLLRRFIYRRVIHLRFSVVQQFLSCLPRIRSRQYLFVSSTKSYLPLQLSTACPQEKSSHKKNHADSEYFTCLLKKCSYLQHMSQSGHLQACKTSGFFFMVIFLVSSPTSTTTFRFQHS